MGLDFTNADAHWSYGGFQRFRERLAAEIGMDLNKMDGFNKSDPQYRGLSWDKIIDPIKPLLDHSDCDGELTAAECRSVAPRLRELVNNWPDDEYDKCQAILLAEGMEYCAKKRKSLVFC